MSKASSEQDKYLIMVKAREEGRTVMLGMFAPTTSNGGIVQISLSGGKTLNK